MHLEQAKKQLQKINQYFEYLDTQTEIATLDRDSLLQQIRTLYDTVLFTETHTPPNTTTEPKEVKEVPTPTPKNKENFSFTAFGRKEERKTQDVAEKQEATRRDEQAAQAKLEVERLANEKARAEAEARQKQIEEETRARAEAEAAAKRAEAERLAHIQAEEARQKQEAAEARAREEAEARRKEEEARIRAEAEKDKTTELDSEVEALFAFKEAKELSQKLSEAPIKNLKNAMGLNEKFLYINELFTGEVAAFNQALERLNGLANFEEAKVYMQEELVEQYSWLKDTSQASARDFIKLVRRRFLE